MCHLMISDLIKSDRLKTSTAWWNATANNTAYIMLKELNGTYMTPQVKVINLSEYSELNSLQNYLIFNFSHVILAVNKN